ncbi:tripartite tricarboxylate transporter substrate binding protein [Variovorax rhizosphaerae]|uniref:Tripartite tricarboxylate transporter substrate binding protein n=1 Tax=Variovorax rhizosphaerae TaxID=1836200 RepID=A0ABU8WU97_9BURK
MTGLTRRAALAAPLLLLPTYPHAQSSWSPTRPISLIVTFAAGGSTDALARRLAEALGKSLGQPCIVENRPGAGGNIGMTAVARAAPDGHVIGIGANGPLAVNPALPNMRMPYDAAKDFTPVIRLVNQSNILLVNPSVPASPMPAFRDWLRAHPNEPFGMPGNGTSNHIAGLVFARALGATMEPVAYRGSAPAQLDLLAGNIRLQVDSLAGNVISMVREGKMRAVAVTTATRSPLLPDVPSMTEFGAPAMPVWQGVVAPRGLPEAALRRLNAAFNEALSQPAIRDWLLENGAVPAGGTPEAFAAFLTEERTKWARLVRENGIKGE